MVETAKAVGTAKVGKDGDKNKGEYPNFAQVSWIRYPITFRKEFVPVSVLLDSGREIDAIHPTFDRKLGLPIRTTDVEA